MNRKSSVKRFLPLILSAVIVVIDQITKMWVVKNIPLYTIHKVIGNDFIWICHVRNTGAGFSLGANGSAFARILFFIIVPVVFIGAMIHFVVTDKKSIFTPAQRWFVAGIIGGGCGTICDRIFRFSEGVVDFISVNFYGLLGMERWPTFNVSDSCVVIFVILFVVSVLFTKEEKK